MAYGRTKKKTMKRINISGLFLVMVVFSSQTFPPKDKERNLVKLFDNPVKNFDSLKVVFPQMTSGVFNNKGRLVTDKYSKVYVKYSLGDVFNVIVLKKQYDYLDNKNERIVSFATWKNNRYSDLINCDLKIDMEKDKVVALLGKPHFESDSLIIYHNQKDKVAFFLFKNNRIIQVQISQFNIDITKNGVPKFRREGMYFPKY